MGNNFIDEVCDNMHGIEYKYNLLSRMEQDCKYYLQHPHENHLWAGNVEEHIEDMKKIYNSFPEEEKPEWLSMEEIETYEKEMKALTKTSAPDKENKTALKKLEQKNMAEAPFEIWVGNLASYVEGKLEGKWLSLPQPEENLKEALAEISRNGEDEIAIMDYSFRADCIYLEKCFGEWSNVTDLNVIANLIGEENHAKVEAYLNSNQGLSLLEIANLFMQEEEISFYEYEFDGSSNQMLMARLSNEEKMGYTLIEQDMELKNQLESMQIGGANVLSYLDVEAIGRDCAMNGTTLYEHGYYLPKGGPDLNHYTMEEIAEEVAAREQIAEERKEAEIQEEEVTEGTVKERVHQKIEQKAPSL